MAWPGGRNGRIVASDFAKKVKEPSTDGGMAIPIVADSPAAADFSASCFAFGPCSRRASLASSARVIDWDTISGTACSAAAAASGAVPILEPLAGMPSTPLLPLAGVVFSM